MTINTVFVIGAGASSEAGLPTGNELKKEISNLLYKKTRSDGEIDKDIERVIHAHLRDGQRVPSEDYLRYDNACRHIANALPLAISIDNFIDAHQNKEEFKICAKLAIVKSILNAERKSKLYFDQNSENQDIRYNGLNDTWYLYFFQLLTENSDFEQLGNRFQSITLIIFNYDRCLEHFMVHALKRYYGVSMQDAAETVDQINIYHPYGKVGSILTAGENHMEFGGIPNARKLYELSTKIRTFTESSDKSSEYLEKIHAKMRGANRLIFLGFGFHELNMKLIAPNDTNNSDLRCYASTYEIEKSGQQVINSRINKMFGYAVQPKFYPAKCHDFFKYFLMSLGFSDT